MKVKVSFAVLCMSVLLLASCGAGRSSDNDAPFFQMRGIVLAWDDISDPVTIDWLSIMHENGLNTISVFGKDYTSEEYLAFKQKCIDEGFDFEYEEHAMSWLLPRDLFET